MEIVQDENALKSSSKAEKVAPSYDANKKYQWTPDTSFVMNGQDFGILLNTVRSILATPEAERIMLAMQASNSLDRLLSSAVNSGIVKEAP